MICGRFSLGGGGVAKTYIKGLTSTCFMCFCFDTLMKYYFIHTPKFGNSLVNPCPIYATFTSEPLFMQDVINHFSARVQL